MTPRHADAWFDYGLEWGSVMRSQRWRLGFLCAAALLPPVACGGGSDSALVTVRDSAGVRIVELVQQEGEDLVVPMHVADLSPPDEVLPATPWGVATHPASGRTYVADRFSDRVVVFDGAGAFIGEFGQPGGGPGEFGNPSALYFGTDETLRVWDTGRGVISRWSPEGEHLGEEITDVPYWGPGFLVESDRLDHRVGDCNESGMGMDQRLTVYRGEEQATFFELYLPMQMMELPCMTRPAPTVFAPSLTWASRGNRTFVHRPPGYQIDVFDDTTLVTSIRRSVPGIAVTQEMAEEAVEFGPTPYRSLLRTCNVTPAQVVRAVGYEDEAPAVLAVSVGPDRGVWVTRTEDGTHPSSVDVFGPDGTFRFSVQVSAAVVGFPSPTSFLTLRLDRETGEAVLSLYSLGGTIQAHARQAGLARQAGPSRDAESERTVAEHWTPPAADGELEPLSEFRDCPGCPVMVVLPPGRYVMGSPEGEGLDEVREYWHHLFNDEKPQVEVEIGYSLAMGKFEVTFRQWERCRDAGACDLNPDTEGHGKGDRPVLNVGRLDAEQYLAWLSQETGRSYRLPSEAEWEYAARAGSSTARYWGDDIGTGHAACNGCGAGWNRSTAPVGTFAPNAFGLHDMLGNAREWTEDCYSAANDNGTNDGRPVLDASPYWEDGTCSVWVNRGGGWRAEPYQLRAAARRPYNTRGPWGTGGSSASGFRVVRSLEVDDEPSAGRR